jgi:quinol-cytochrome oxidoreductase complex cytochrome b subunit
VTEVEARKETKAVSEERSRPFLPNHIIEEIGVVFLITGILLIAAALRRPEPFGFPSIFFMGVLEMIDLVSPLFGALVIFATVILLLAMPFLDRSEDRHPRKRPIYFAIILALVVFWATFTVMGYL